jgi:hypothetical protein
VKQISIIGLRIVCAIALEVTTSPTLRISDQQWRKWVTTNPKTFLKHYRERVKPEIAASFWRLAPVTPSNLRSFRKANAA